MCGPGSSTWPSSSTWHPFDLSPWAVGIWDLSLGAQPSSWLYPDITEHAVLLVLGQRGFWGWALSSALTAVRLPSLLGERLPQVSAVLDTQVSAAPISPWSCGPLLDFRNCPCPTPFCPGAGLDAHVPQPSWLPCYGPILSLLYFRTQDRVQLNELHLSCACVQVCVSV